MYTVEDRQTAYHLSEQVFPSEEQVFFFKRNNHKVYLQCNRLLAKSLKIFNATYCDDQNYVHRHIHIFQTETEKRINNVWLHIASLARITHNVHKMITREELTWSR